MLALPPTNCVRGGKPAIHRYKVALLKRQSQYPAPPSSEYPKIVTHLNEHGYAILPNVVDTQLLDSIMGRADELIKAKETKIYKDAPDHFRSVMKPFCNIPQLAKLAHHPTIIDIGAAYFNCLPLLMNGSVRRSFVTEDARTTQLFHVDPDSIKFIKFFIYLHDVDMETGPFTIVGGSVNKKFPRWSKRYRWTHEEIVSKYGKDKIKYLTAKKGDLVIANPTGFHRGYPPKSKQRTMITLDYGIHSPKWAPKHKRNFPISQHVHKDIPNEYKPVFGLMEVE